LSLRRAAAFLSTGTMMESMQGGRLHLSPLLPLLLGVFLFAKAPVGSASRILSGNGHRYGSQAHQLQSPPVPNENAIEEPYRGTHSMDRPAHGGHFVTGFCAEDPCPPDMDCCCWSTAGTPEHPDYPNDSAAEQNRTCGAEPPDLVAAGLVLRPDCFTEPSGCGDNGVYAELKASGQEVYEDRELCCVRDKMDVEVQSQQTIDEVIPTTPPPPPWTPAPTVPPPTKTAFDHFAEDDLAAADMEVSATNYADAAASVQSAASDLNDTGKSMERLFDLTKGKRETAARLRGAMGDFTARTAQAINQFEAEVAARTQRSGF